MPATSAKRTAVFTTESLVRRLRPVRAKSSASSSGRSWSRRSGTSWRSPGMSTQLTAPRGADHALQTMDARGPRLRVRGSDLTRPFGAANQRTAFTLRKGTCWKGPQRKKHRPQRPIAPPQHKKNRPQRPIAPPQHKKNRPQRPIAPPQRPIAPPQRPIAPPQRPYVQFFNKAVAIHGAFWHREFGRVKSHGCVNLAPQDAKVLFDFTSPHLPEGWAAVFPTRLEPGTVIRVR